MEEVFDDYKKQASDVHEANLLTKIWLSPTETLAYILEYCPQKYVIPLLGLGGIVRAVDRASLKDMGDNMSTLGVLSLAIIVGGLFGWIAYYIYAWGMSVTGGLINGEAMPEDFRTVIAWALIPSVCTLLLVIPEAIIFGDDLFKSEPVNDSLFNNSMWVLFGMTEIALSIWSLVILVKGTMLIQNFGTGKAILNVVLPGLVIILPIIIVAFLYNLIV